MLGRRTKIVSEIEDAVTKSTGQTLDDVDESICVDTHTTVGLLDVVRTVFGHYPRRAVLGVSLFVGQAFLYNAVFFTFSLVLATFYGVASNDVGYYLIAFAVGNFLGPLLLGRLFDVVGRRVMIAGTYLLSGAMLGVTAYLFDHGVLTATTQTLAWVVIFFFASAGASAAYLTVSEIFPMETRALAIAIFYAVGTGLGGIVGPVLFGNLIATKRPGPVAFGYLLGGVLMFAAGLVEVLFGVDAEQRSLKRSQYHYRRSRDSTDESETDAASSSLKVGRSGPLSRRWRGSAAWSPSPLASTFRQRESLFGERSRCSGRRTRAYSPQSQCSFLEPRRLGSGVRAGFAKLCVRAWRPDEFAVSVATGTRRADIRTPLVEQPVRTAAKQRGPASAGNCSAALLPLECREG